jgi:hypothetical protein
MKHLRFLFLRFTFYVLNELAAFSSTQRNNAEDPFDEFQNVGKDNFFVIFVASSMKNQCSQQWT